ncbi:hypothetical protein BGX33_012632 [Mortierella sp. NVP41]|nr:hypothetical protein BGX33_012632 [Mortierella sp. NVP41]
MDLKIPTNQDRAKSNALIPCNKVFNISELHEVILSFMGPPFEGDSRRCVLVCRHWQRLFTPHLRQNFTLSALCSDAIRKSFGSHVRRLTLNDAIGALITLIPKEFPNVEHLHLRIESASHSIGYGLLRKVFAQMESRLLEVHIDLNALVFDPSHLWSLAWLPHLVRLGLKVSHSTSYDILSGILDCCPALQSLDFDVEVKASNVTFHSPPTYQPQQRLTTWQGLQQKLGFPGNLAPPPSSPQKVWTSIAIDQSRSRQSIHSTNSKGDRSSPSPNNNNSNSCGRNLCRLCFKGIPSNILHFRNSINHLSRLEELVILNCDRHLYWSQTAIDENIWSLVEQCRCLRTIHIITEVPLPSISTLILPLCHLETFSFLFFRPTSTNDRPDPDYSTLDAALQEHFNQHGQVHPLRNLIIGGDIEFPYKSLRDILLIDVSQIEILRDGL